MPSRQSASHNRAHAVHPPAVDRQTAARLSDLLLRQGGRGRFRVINDAGESVDLPPALLNVLETAAGIAASGAGVAVLARDDLLTSQQAADLLNVSRQYMVRLLERGDMPSSKVGAHRRVRAQDLEVYRQNRDAGRRAALAVMAEQAQADGAYDGPAVFGPRRGG